MSQTNEIYEVFIEENSHFGDENERYKSGEFADYDEALKHCKKIVDDFLEINYKKAMTAEELYQLYTFFGEDAFIVGTSTGGFSAREYARKRCREICGENFSEEI